VYNRAERSAGWILLTAGVILLGAWGAVKAVTALLDAPDLPWWVTGAIFVAAAGLFVLVVSAVRERIYRRSRTRYRDVIR
jgi:membrane protein implicated in regulation of membrane protease activity